MSIKTPGSAANALPPRTVERQANVNGIVGTVFSSLSLIGWLTLSSLMVSYETGVVKPEPTGDGQRDLAENLSYGTEIAVRKTGAFAANSFLSVVGGALSGTFLLVGIITSGIGLAYPGKTYSIVGMVLGFAALICGILFLCWRWSVWFG